MTRVDERKRENYHYMAEALRRLEFDLHGRIGGSGRIPAEWHGIAQGGGAGPKVKVTLWVEKDVLGFFRALGRGHTTRMADVLKTFMHARIAGVVKGPEAVDYRPVVEEPVGGDRLSRSVAALGEAIRRGV